MKQAQFIRENGQIAIVMVPEGTTKYVRREDGLIYRIPDRSIAEIEEMVRVRSMGGDMTDAMENISAAELRARALRLAQEQDTKLATVGVTGHAVLKERVAGSISLAASVAEFAALVLLSQRLLAALITSSRAKAGAGIASTVMRSILRKIVSRLEGKVATIIISGVGGFMSGGGLDKVTGLITTVISATRPAQQAVKESIQADEDLGDAEAKAILAERKAAKTKRQLDKIKAESRYRAKLETKFNAEYSAWLELKEFYDQKSLAQKTAKTVAISRITALTENLVSIQTAIAEHRFDLRKEYDQQQEELAAEYDKQINDERLERNRLQEESETEGTPRPTRTRQARLY
jgi:hypothetical protein